MRLKRLWIPSTLLLLAACTTILPEDNRSALAPSTLATVYDAVFEVVVPKPTQDSLTYERPLPFELLPFAERNDRYHSIGTAFAIGPNRYLTAAHVLGLGHQTQFDEPALRDRAGNLYAIDQIFGFDLNRDVVLFSLHNAPAIKPMSLHPNPQLNSVVFAVGNAMGEGVVVRDGLFTSTTPENLDGEWKWLRFSAAASPGNSGGPLLDQQGRVIGLITMRSDNENLNYALPIAEVPREQSQVAVCKRMMQYRLENMDMVSTGVLDETIPLPKSYATLHAELRNVLDDFIQGLFTQLIENNRAQIFPQGEASRKLLHRTATSIFPLLIAKGEDGNWEAFAPEETSNADLGNGGRITHGSFGKTLMIQLKRPRDVSGPTLFSDSKLFMDLLLKGIYSTRRVGPEKIKVTSLGPAREERTHADAHGRRWQVRTWDIEHNDHKVITFSLPTPEGCITLLRSDLTWKADASHLLDLEFLSDFVYVSYYGTLQEWQGFLQLSDLLPTAFADLQIDFEYGRELAFRSKRMTFHYNDDLLDISPESDLLLAFGFFLDDGQLRWDVGRLMVGESKSSQAQFNIYRDIRPPEDLGDNFRSDWLNMVKRLFPYDEKPFFEDTQTRISAVLAAPPPGEEPGLLYNVHLMRDGVRSDAEMTAQLSRFVEGIEIFEN